MAGTLIIQVFNYPDAENNENHGVVKKEQKQQQQKNPTQPTKKNPKQPKHPCPKKQKT